MSQKEYKLEPCYLIHKLETRRRPPDLFLIILLNFDGLQLFEIFVMFTLIARYLENFVSKISWKLLELGP